MRIILSTFLICSLPLLSMGQYDSNPCDFRDSLDRLELKAHGYNEPGWYDNLDKVYLVIEYERDTDHLPDTAVANYPDIDLKVYVDNIQGTIFNGLTFFRKTATGWTEFLIEFDHNLKTEYSIRRPDSIKQPSIIELTYIEGHAATRGSYEGKVHEVWDVLKHVRLSKLYSSFSEGYTSEAIDGSFTEGHSYEMNRGISFDGTKLFITNTSIHRTASMRSNVEGEDQSEKVESSSDSCVAATYQLVGGWFIKK